MSNNVKENLELKRKRESRDIVNEIMNFGVTQEQLYDIMFNISLNLENNKNMKEISSFLKKQIILLMYGKGISYEGFNHNTAYWRIIGP